MISMHTFVVCKSILVNRVWQCDRKETAVQMVYFIVLHSFIWIHEPEKHSENNFSKSVDR